MNLQEVSLGNFMVSKGGSINPKKYLDEKFELYSIPAYDKGSPELIIGSNIGSSKKIVKPNDILLSRIVPHIRRAWVVEKHKGLRQIGSGEWIIFRGKDIHPNFLKYFLCSDNFHPKLMQTISGVGGSLLRARPSEVAKLKIPLPSLEMQKKIAAVLDRADQLRQKRKKTIEKLEQLTQSIFLEMFGYPSINPKQLPIVTIGDVTSQVKDGPHVSPKYSEKGVPILSTRNVRPSKLFLHEMKYVSKDTYAELTKVFKPQKNDILLTKGGTTGYAKVVDFDWEFCVWVHLAVLRPLANINPLYLESALNSKYCYAQSQKYTHGIANRDLGLTRIKKIKLLLPAIEQQLIFANKIKRINRFIQIQVSSLDTYENLFNSLLQKAFRGELSFNDRVFKKLEKEMEA
ncbi:restriction endonuclease subunit S [Candidatus Riflebacteria bacterium]